MEKEILSIDKIIILDFGSQYTHLIARRIRDLHVYSEIVEYSTSIETIKEINPKGIILSGGSASVYAIDAPKPDSKIFELGIPILGICYGHQLIVENFGGKVEKQDKREYGPASLRIKKDNTVLLDGIKNPITVWMSHGDAAQIVPNGFVVLANTDNSDAAVMADKNRNIYGIQFHPEVAHTEMGSKILENFIVKISKAKQEWTVENFLELKINEFTKLQGNVLCATSGGVDSTVTSILLNRAIGGRVTCLLIDNGLLRKDEAREVLDSFKTLGVDLQFVDASEKFLGRLKGVSDPEEKRRIIRRVFIETLKEFAEINGRFRYLAQGTLYPDVIESGVSKGPAAIIKTHHNVGDLYLQLGLELIEPLRSFYKDEVRSIGRALGIPEKMINRHPFPGPGLGVRVIGEITGEKLRICREASAIVEEELIKEGFYDKVWQAFAIVGDDRVTAVVGDERRYGHLVTIKMVNSLDAMTANWSRVPYEIIDRIGIRIPNEVRDVAAVTYFVSNKPPATIEPQ